MRYHFNSSNKLTCVINDVNNPSQKIYTINEKSSFFLILMALNSSSYKYLPHRHSHRYTELDMATDLLCLVLGALLVVLVPLLWKVIVINLIWRPYALQRSFRKQGLAGPSYKLLSGGSIQEIKSIRDASKDLILDKNSHDFTPRVLPHYKQWIDLYGSTFVFWFGAQPRITITDPEMIKQVLSNKFGFYSKLKPSSGFLALLGKGLVIVEGSEWAMHRRIINPAFAMDKLKMLTKEMAECAKVMLEGWQNQITQAENEEKEIEVGKQFEELTADVISHTAFGSSYIEGKEVFLAQKELQTIVSQSALTIDIPGLGYLPTKRNLNKWKLERKIRKKLMDVVKNRLVDSKDQTYGNDLLGLLLEANQKEDNQKLSMDDIIDECKTFFFAGHETTSHLLTWTFFLLSINQDWQEKLREEVLRECGVEVPNADSLSKLKLVTMVIFETLRLYSPVTLTGRRASTDTTLGNIQIPKDTGVMIPIGIIQRSEELWGADANEFNPLRFENGVSKAAKHPNALLAFSMGPRACIGQNFAMLEAKSMVAMILQRFSFSLSHSYKHAPMELITLRPKYGLPIVFRSLDA